MFAKRFFYVCAGLLCLALAYHLGARNAGAQAGTSSPEQGAQSLETRVSSLERRLTVLEKAIGGKTQDRTGVSLGRSPKAAWKILANWREQLHTGMSKGEIRALMGDPDKIDKYILSGEVWSYGYPSGGEIRFGADGRVESWSEPAPQDR